MTLWRVVRTELVRLRRTGTFTVLGVLLAALVATSGLVAWRAERAYEAQRRRYASTVDAQWAAQPERHPHRVSHYGYLLFRPRSPLSVFDPGVTAHTGSTLFLEAHRQNSMNFAEAAQADSPLRFGSLSMAVILQLLVPLVLFVAAAGAVAREREDGTLALVRSLGVSWGVWLGGKTLALAAATLAVVVPGVLVVGAGLALSGETAWTADAWSRAAALGAAHVLYFLLCAALGVIVSALCRTSRDATLVLVGLWLVLWVLVPRVVPAAASAARSLPTRAAFEADVERRTRALGDSHNPADEKFAAFKADVLAKAGVARGEDLPINYNGVQMIEGERLTTEAYRGMRDALAAVRQAHERAASVAGAGAPYLAIRLVSMALAGVDVAYVDDFERQAEDYRYALVQHLNQLHADEVAHADDRYVAVSGSEAPTRKRIEAGHWRESPQFEYRPLPLAASVGRAGTACLVLASWAAGVIVVLWRLRPEVSA